MEHEKRWLGMNRRDEVKVEGERYDDFFGTVRCPLDV